MGLLLKIIFQPKIKLIFTSAAQRKHSAYTKWLIRRMDKVIATSKKIGKFLDVTHDVIMHGINTEIYLPTINKGDIKAKLGLPEGRLIGCFGRIRYQKGIDIFVKSLIKVCKLHPEIYGIICGRITQDNEKYTKYLKGLIKHAGLEKKIIF